MLRALEFARVNGGDPGVAQFLREGSSAGLTGGGEGGISLRGTTGVGALGVADEENDARLRPGARREQEGGQAGEQGFHQSEPR